MKLIVLAASFSILTFLSACTSAPITPNYQTNLHQLTFEHLKKIPVDVKDIDIGIQTQRGATAWDVSTDMPTPPDIAVRRYLNQRFDAKGDAGVLTMTIQKATMSVEEVPNDNRFLAFIPFADQHDFTFEVVLDLESQYHSGLPDRKTTTRFVRKIKLPPHVTIAYREAALQRALEKMLVDMDESIAIALSNEFSLIKGSDIPHRAIEVKTEIPEIETIYSKKDAVVQPIGADAGTWITTREVNK